MSSDCYVRKTLRHSMSPVNKEGLVLKSESQISSDIKWKQQPIINLNDLFKGTSYITNN